MAFDRHQASPGRNRRSLDHLPLTRRYLVRIADDEELPELAALVERHIPGITNAYESARRVHLHHRGSVGAVVRDERIVGTVACLYLNSTGLARLRSGTFSFREPEVDALAVPGEPPAAIYIWALCLPATTIGAIGNVMLWLQRPLYRQADIFARPGTIGGMRFMRDTGFVASAFCTPDLWIYQRHPCSNFEYQLILGLEENDPSAPAIKFGDGHDDESRAQRLGTRGNPTTLSGESKICHCTTATPRREFSGISIS
jgi:hypothetical protein